MGRVWTLSRWPLAALVLALFLVIAVRGDSGSPAEAVTFAPTTIFSLDDTNATTSPLTSSVCALGPASCSQVNDNPTLTFTTTIPPGKAFTPTRDAFFGQFFNFVPDSISLKLDTGGPYGDTTGGAEFFIRLGLGNGQCSFPFPGAVTLLEATTSRASVVDFVSGFQDGPTGTFPGGVANGLEEAVDNYPLFLTQTTPADPNDPSKGLEIARFWGNVLVGPQPVDVHFQVFAKGSFGLNPALGQPTLIQTATDDVAVATPSATTDTCAGFSATTTLLGITLPNPNTGGGGGAAAVTLPATGQTAVFSLLGQSLRDADNDFIDGGDDTCPFNPNVGSPYTLVDAGDVGETAFFGPVVDGIDAACDNSSVTTDGNATPWDATSTCRAGAGDDLNGITVGPVIGIGVDCDLDGFPNRQDNCPQVANPSQLNSDELSVSPFAADGGPNDDSTGDACDVIFLGSTGAEVGLVSDGHFHNAFVVQAICVTDPDPEATVDDSDGDGFCDPTEAALGSDVNDSGKTPENLAIPTSCDDGVDNDLDGTFDIDDIGCQTSDGLHDIQIKKFSGAKGVNPGQTALHYTLQLQNKSGVAETVTLGISVTATSSGCWPMAAQLGGSDKGLLVNAVGGDVGNPGAGTLGTVNLSSNPNATKPVPFTVYLNPSCPAAAVGTALYTVAIDVCHGNDPAPLGLFGSASCPGTADGNQDRATPLGANDAPVSITVTQAP